MLRSGLLAVIAVTSVAHANKPVLSLDDGVFASSVRFPAVSSDGTQLAVLRGDNDLDGAPFTTLVVWSTATGAVIASFSVGGAPNAGVDPKLVLARANAWLAKTKWRDAPYYVAPHVGASSVTIAGTTFAFDADHENTEFDNRRVRVVSNRIIRFDRVCESVPRGFDLAFGAGKLVVLLLDPAPVGDNCARLPSADTAMAFVLP
jgi:hypothetical protein